MGDRISIIVPVYNAESYLKRCLDSIINQTYKNIEIILIDDGSTDKSGMICDEYKSHDDRIIVIHKANSGVSSARNSGLDIAGGEYIAFIDSDDYVPKNYLEMLLNDMTDETEMVVCGPDTYLPNGGGNPRSFSGILKLP